MPKSPFRAGEVVKALYLDPKTGGTTLGKGSVLTCVADEPRANTSRDWTLTVDLGEGLERTYRITSRRHDYITAREDWLTP